MRILFVYFIILVCTPVIQAQKVAFTKIVDKDAIFNEVAKYPYGSKIQKKIIDSISTELYRHIRDFEVSADLREDIKLYVGNMISLTGSFGQRLRKYYVSQDTVTQEVRQLAVKLQAHQDSITRVLCALKNIIEDDQQPRKTRELAVKTFTREPRPGVLKYVLKYRDSLVFGEYNEWDDHFQSTMTTATQSLYENYSLRYSFNVDNAIEDLEKKDSSNCDVKFVYPRMNYPETVSIWAFLPYMIDYFDEYNKLTFTEYFLFKMDYLTNYKKPWLLYEFMYANIDKKDSYFGKSLLEEVEKTKKEYLKKQEKTKE